MIKYLTIALLCSQTLAAPGLGGFGGVGMNPWFSQFAGGNPAAAPWLSANPWFAAAQPVAPAGVPANLPAPWWLNPPAAPAPSLLPAPLPQPSVLPAFGKGGFGIGAINKQLGMLHAIIGTKSKAAEDEVKLEIDTLKTNAAAVVPADECSTAASDAATEIENQLTIAFDKCDMKNEINQLRIQGMGIKGQLVAMKMAKKACKGSLDMETCIADATGVPAGETPGSTIQASVTDIITKSDECIDEVKTELLEQIQEASDNLVDCLLAKEE